MSSQKQACYQRLSATSNINTMISQTKPRHEFDVIVASRRAFGAVPVAAARRLGTPVFCELVATRLPATIMCLADTVTPATPATPDAVARFG